jgi:ATP-dependent RNA helicase SUPV3L1/SUV3
VRVDILERLADIIRPLVAYDANRPVDTPPPEGAAEGNGFRVTVEMTSLLGCAGEDFASILKSLGYRVRRTPKAPAEVAPAENQLAEPVADTALAEAALEGAPVESVPTPSSEPIAEAALAEASIAVADAEPVPAAMEASPAEAEAATPAEPEYDEVWFPAGRRPERNNRPQRNKPDGNRAPRPEGQQRFKGKGGKPNHHNGKGPREDAGEATLTLLPLREKVAGAKRRSDEGCAASASTTVVCAQAQRTPHPPLRGTFSLKGRRGAVAPARLQLSSTTLCHAR